MTDKRKATARAFLKVLGEMSPETANMAKSYAEGLAAAESLRRCQEAKAKEADPR